jgi:hypothetical protein
MKHVYLLIVPLLLLTSNNILSVNALHQYSDPVGDFYLSGNASKINSPLEPVDIRFVDAYYNETHFMIVIKTDASVDSAPSYPEVYQFSLVVYSDNEVNSLFSDIYVDDENGWNVFGLINDTDKIKSNVDEDIYIWLIERDIGDLGGSPEYIQFLVYTLYENPESEILRVFDAAPQQNITWVPPFIGASREGSSYFTLNFTSSIVETMDPVEKVGKNIPGYNVFTIFVSLTTLIFLKSRIRS